MTVATHIKLSLFVCILFQLLNGWHLVHAAGSDAVLQLVLLVAAVLLAALLSAQYLASNGSPVLAGDETLAGLGPVLGPMAGVAVWFPALFGASVNVALLWLQLDPGSIDWTFMVAAMLVGQNLSLLKRYRIAPLRAA